MNTKTERLTQANELIGLISSCGRRFFYNKTHDRIARLELCKRGRVYFVDDYTGKRIYTHRTGITSRWHGFSHGGTLRSLVENLRDYIMFGTPLPHGPIVPAYQSSQGNIWGYDEQSAKLLKEQTSALAIFTPTDSSSKIGRASCSERGCQYV